MAADPRSYVRPGDPVRLAAAQVNAVNDLMRRPPTAAAPPPPPRERPYTWCWAKNVGGAAVTRGGVAHVTGLMQDVSTTAGFASYLDGPCLEVNAFYQQSDPLNPPAICISLDTIAPNDVGRVAVSGLVQARVNVIDAGHRYALVAPSNSGVLTSSAAGGHRLVYTRPYVGVQDCVVRIGEPRATTLLALRNYTIDWPRRTTQFVTLAGTSNFIAVAAYNALFDMPALVRADSLGRLVVLAPVAEIPSLGQGDSKFIVVAWEE